MALDGIEALVRGFGRHDGVLPHLKELDERLTDRGIVFDDQNNRSWFRYHVKIIVKSPFRFQPYEHPIAPLRWCRM
jgi:hypothetical protein